MDFPGSGSLSIAAGGVVNTGSAYSNGTTTISGTGSQWNLVGGTLDTNGVLTISGGGIVNSGGFGIAGTATVSGPGSQLNAQVISVGLQAGTLSIQGGGAVNISGGSFPVALIDSSVTVSGAGSQLNAPSLYLGAFGSGSLSIQDGAVVNAGSLSVGQGENVATTGSVLVSGSDSQLLTTDAGVGVGALLPSTGSVLIDGATWINSGSLNIGTNGTGSVTIQNLGQLTSGSITLGAGGSLIVDPSVVNDLGDFMLLPGGILSLDIAGLTPGLFSQLNIGGFGLFQGTIDLDFIGGFVPGAGYSFDLINALGGADFSGATIVIQGLDPSFDYSDNFANGEFVLTAGSPSGVPEPSAFGLIAILLISLPAIARYRLGNER